VCYLVDTLDADGMCNLAVMLGVRTDVLEMKFLEYLFQQPCSYMSVSVVVCYCIQATHGCCALDIF